MNIGILCGHGQGDPGAIGNGYQEQALTRELGPLVKAQIGNVANVFIFDTNLNPFANIAAVLNWIKVNGITYVLEIHFNSGGTPYGVGTEIYVTGSEKYVTVEQKIINNLATLFPPARSGGVKKMDFRVIRNIKSMGISAALVETCFINNPKEVAVYQNNKTKVAQLIAKGIIDGFGLSGKAPEIVEAPKEQPKQIETDMTVVAKRVINGEFGDGADRKKNLQAAGYDYNVVQPIVNQLLGVGKPSTQLSKKSNEQIADDIIRGTGEWKNVTGQARKDKLKAMGYDAAAVQAIINRKLR